MDSAAVALFTLIFSALGIQEYPKTPDNLWQVTNGWQSVTNGKILSVTSSGIVEQCKHNPNTYISFPQIVHSYHEFFLDKIPIASHGHQDFSRASPFYERPFLRCSTIKDGNILEWRVTTYSSFFARLREWPEMTANPHVYNITNVSLNMAAFGILIILSIFSILIYKGRVHDNLTYSLGFGSLFLSFYFLNSVNSYFGLSYDMLTSHKVADGGLWIGAMFFINAFYSEKLLNYNANIVFRTFCVLGILTIIAGKNGNEVQLGTMIPMIPFFYCAITIVISLIKDIKTNQLTKSNSLKVFAILLFAILGLNDALNVTGIIRSEMLLSIGSVGGFFGLSIAVSQAIEKTYDERDALLHGLEKKVTEKTQHLENALATLKSTQAELVESARLASLGTLSAGIAHEINNSINYVNGALIPLERKIQSTVAEKDRELIDKLLASIKEGTFLTVEIVKSLRNFTGLNQAKLKTIDLSEIVNSVLTILKSKTRNINLSIDIPENCSLTCNPVGLNQVFMNLITNSIDALDKDLKTISIRANIENDNINIAFEDNGSGISKEIIDRIYDPFYTTKEVGRGTGLGLHIVKKEIEKHKGKIRVTSKVGLGTKFEITLPRNAFEQFTTEAA